MTAKTKQPSAAALRQREYRKRKKAEKTASEKSDAITRGKQSDFPSPDIDPVTVVKNTGDPWSEAADRVQSQPQPQAQPKPGSSPGASDAQPGPNVPVVISFAELLERVINPLLMQSMPDFAMTKHEETAIGAGMDFVIDKHFPWLKNAGPEAALVIALSGYGIRVWNIRREKRQTEMAHAAAAHREAATMGPQVDGVQ